MQSMHFPSSHTHAHTFVLLDLTFVQIIMQLLYGRNLNQNLTSLTNILALLVVKKKRKEEEAVFLIETGQMFQGQNFQISIPILVEKFGPH